MTDTRRCCGCGAELPPDAPLGLCPKCVLKQGLDSLHGTASSPAATGFSPPLIEDLAPHFPHLEILEFLGQGGMGAVYKARQPELDRLVALKILSPDTGKDPAFAERFKREARSLARLNHPHIVAVYDFGQAAGLYYFVMEYVDGVDLRHLEQSRRPGPREALGIVVQICEALQYAHEEGIVHRDIKPENLLIDKKGRVKIADFGLAKLMARTPKDFTLTQAEQVMGTPHYMAPEQMEHPAEVDQRADIYSLGVVLYEMLTGELPLGRFQPPSRKVHMDVRLDEVVLKTLEREPERRYQQASQVKTDVEWITVSPRPAATAGEARPAAPAAGPAGAPAPAPAPARPRFSRAAIVGAVLAPLAIALAGPLAAVFMVGHIAAPGGGQEAGPWSGITMLAIVGLGLVGLVAPIATTILGIVSISQIRRSCGRLYGMGLALFDALVFPLLALDCHLVLACCLAIGHEWGSLVLPIALGVLIAVAMDVLIVWLVNRAVRRPVPGAAAAS